MEYTRYIGWDVHAATIAVAVAEAGRRPAHFEGTIPTQEHAVRQWVQRQPDATTVLVCYEAGPTGFEMARLLGELGVACQVIAPGLVPKRATDRMKTDRRDAVRLAEASRAGTLTPVRVPTRVEEAFRDLVRTRTRAVDDQSRVRRRVKSALLRWGVAIPVARRDWTAAYVAWIRHWSPDEAPRAQAWAELLSQLEEGDARVQRTTAAIQRAWPDHPLAALIRALQALRGIDWLTAATLVAECGDFSQFAHPRQLMSFLGLVPRESSSGLSRHQGGISKTGNAHVRRVLLQGVQTYRLAPSLHGPSWAGGWRPVDLGRRISGPLAGGANNGSLFVCAG
ncbi:MAG: IS110 family RNA-guided transposase [Candidatus Limnocylindrales bacterium]